MGFFSWWFGEKDSTVFIPKEDAVVEPEFVVDLKKFRTVPKWAHAARGGTDIFCPRCSKPSRVFHFAWLLEIRKTARLRRRTNPRDRVHSDKLLRINDVLDRLNVSRETLRRWRKTGLFPNPKHLGRGDFRLVWDPSEIEDWIKTRPAGRFRQ